MADRSPTPSPTPSVQPVPTSPWGRWLRIGIVSFGSILLAEMGDKTQLATMLLSARAQNPVLTFIGAASALIATSLIGVWAGAWVARRVSPRLIKITAGIGFMAIGGVILWRAGWGS